MSYASARTESGERRGGDPLIRPASNLLIDLWWLVALVLKGAALAAACAVRDKAGR